MEILELLPFIGLLVLQFIYQIYKAYKKKTTPMEASSEEVGASYSSPLESMEEEMDNNPRRNDEEHLQEDGFYDINSPVAKNKTSSSGATFSIIDELFGEQFPASVKNLTPRTGSVSSRTDLSNEDQLEKEYDEVKFASRIKKSYSAPPIKTGQQKTTPALELFKKMHSKQNLKDYWKVKFILDQPVGMEITPLGRTNQIPFQPPKQIDATRKRPPNRQD